MAMISVYTYPVSGQYGQVFNRAFFGALRASESVSVSITVSYLPRILYALTLVE